MIHEDHGAANSAPPPRGRTSCDSSGSERNLTNATACAERARAAILSDDDREKIEAPIQSGHRHCLAPCVLRLCARRGSGLVAGVEARPQALAIVECKAQD
jgi:hypothetical protein